jgi:hypothetical protein
MCARKTTVSPVPLRRELLARRQLPADLRLGPQQPTVRQGLDLLIYHRGWLPDGVRIWDWSLLHLPSLKPVNLDLNSTKDLVRMRGRDGGGPKLGGAVVLSRHYAAAEP